MMHYHQKLMSKCVLASSIDTATQTLGGECLGPRLKCGYAMENVISKLQATDEIGRNIAS